MHSTEKKSNKKQEEIYTREYNSVFEMVGINPQSINHEWNKEGDVIKECTLYEDQPTPVITPDTYTI